MDIRRYDWLWIDPPWAGDQLLAWDTKIKRKNISFEFDFKEILHAPEIELTANFRFRAASVRNVVTVKWHHMAKHVRFSISV